MAQVIDSTDRSVHISEVDRTVLAEMSSKIVGKLSVVLVLLLLLVLAQSWQVVAGMTVKAQSWEYAIEGPPDEQLPARLQALGSAGWEIVSARRATTERNGRTEGIYELILRRPATAATGTPPLPAAPR